MADAPLEVGALAQKSYGLLADKREARVFKEAQLEQQATRLSRQFLRRRERDVEERLIKEAEHSRVLHERMMQRAAEDNYEKETEGLVAKEISSQIHAEMRERQRERDAEDERRRAEEADRARWVQARTVYEKMALETRLREREQRNQDKGTNLHEKMKFHEGLRQERVNEDREKIRAWQESHQQEADKAEQRRKSERRKHLDNVREQQSALVQKQSEVQERKKKAEEGRLQGYRDHHQKWEDKLDHHYRAVVAAMEERTAKFRDKELRRREKASDACGLASSSREASLSATGGEGAPQRRPVQGRPEAEAAAKRQQPTGREGTPELKEEKSAAGQPTPYWSPDLAQAHARVKKDYVQRVMELDQAKERAFYTKKFGKLAENAKDDEDVQAVRMRSITNAHFAKTAGGKKDATANSVETTTPRGSDRSRRVRPCGFCEREFVTEGLPGSALQKTVDRLKAAQAAAGTQHPSQGPGSPAGAESAAGGVLGASKPSSQSARGATRFYEGQVRLCESCWHYVRVRST